MRLVSITRSTPFHPGSGGMEAVHWDILVGLATRGHEVICITTEGVLSSDSEPDIKIVTLPGNHLKYSGRWLREAAKFTQSLMPDAVLSNSAGAHTLVREDNNFPVLMQAHGTLGNELLARFRSRNPRKLLGLFRQFIPIQREILSLPRYSSVVATAQNTAQMLKSYPEFIRPQRIDLILNGVRLQNLPVNRNCTNSQSPRLLYVGRLASEKGISVLLETLLHIPNSTLTLAGDGPARETFELLSRNLGVNNRVKFLGHIDRQTELPRLMNSSDVLVAPSLGPEGLMLSALEGLAAGLPVVMSESAAAAFGESRPACVLSSIPEPLPLARAIMDAVCIPPLDCVLPSEFTMDAMIDRYESLLTELQRQR